MHVYIHRHIQTVHAYLHTYRTYVYTYFSQSLAHFSHMRFNCDVQKRNWKVLAVLGSKYCHVKPGVVCVWWGLSALARVGWHIHSKKLWKLSWWRFCLYKFRTRVLSLTVSRPLMTDIFAYLSSGRKATESALDSAYSPKARAWTFMGLNTSILTVRRRAELGVQAWLRLDFRSLAEARQLLLVWSQLCADSQRRGPCQHKLALECFWGTQLAEPSRKAKQAQAEAGP